jgi:hypothetical protein
VLRSKVFKNLKIGGNIDEDKAYQIDIPLMIPSLAKGNPLKSLRRRDNGLKIGLKDGVGCCRQLINLIDAFNYHNLPDGLHPQKSRLHSN